MSVGAESVGRANEARHKSTGEAAVAGLERPRGERWMQMLLRLKGQAVDSDGHGGTLGKFGRGGGWGRTGAVRGWWFLG